MLALEIEFLTGRYVATAYNDRTAAEWPPHPARVYSALVAAHYGAGGDAAERRALTWLATLPPPEIQASDAGFRDVPSVFVPVNDISVIDVSKQIEKVSTAEAELAAVAGDDGKSRAGAEKRLAKARADLGVAHEKAIALDKVSADAIRRASQLLPDSRLRQARTFPSVTPDEPVVTLIWPDVDAREHRAALDGLSRKLVRLGHSSSLVAARLTESPRPATWFPGEAGEQRLRVVRPNQLGLLDQLFDLHQEVQPRVLPSAFQWYGRDRSDLHTEHPRSLFGDDWLVFRRTGGPRLSQEATAGLASTLRRALMKYGEEPLPELLTGHGADGAPSRDPHLAIVPLPFVGSTWADGSIKGIALVFPREADPNSRRAIYRAIARWEDEVRSDDEETPPVPVHLGDSGVFELCRVDGMADGTTLQPDTWCRPSRIWRSATPVALDRNPGDLRAGGRAIKEAQATIRAACQRVGLPEPSGVEILPAAPVPGATKARFFPRFPTALDRTQRVLSHVSLTFDRPVRGPVLLGAGRFVGLGLLRPGGDHA